MIVEDGKEYMIKEDSSLKALIKKEADSMSVMRFRMNKANKAIGMDMKFHRIRGIADGRRHRSYREVEPSCILHSCESWSWDKEMFDALHGWESRNLDLMSFKRMDPFGSESGMVQGQSDQESNTEMY